MGHLSQTAELIAARTSLARVNLLAAFDNVTQQNLDIGMLAIEARTAIVLRANNPCDGVQVLPSKSIVLRAKQTAAPARRRNGFDPVIHNSSADEGVNTLVIVPSPYDETIPVMWTVVY